MDRAQYKHAVDSFFDALPASEFERAVCVFCGPSTKTIKLFRKGCLLVVRCECGFVYSAMQPKTKALQRFYAGSQAMAAWAEIKDSPDEDKRQETKYATAVDFVSTSRVRTLLDLGCGTGKFLAECKKSLPDLEALGVDAHEGSVKIARQRGVKALVVDDLAGYLVECAETFDCISLWGVLEHVKDPKALVCEARKRLSPGGHLIVCVPNVESLVVRRLWDKCFTFCPQHLWYFDHKTLPLVAGLCDLKHAFSYTIEPEEWPVLRYEAGIKPYGKIPRWAHEKYVAPFEARHKQDILDNGSGYKIVAAFQK